MTPELPPTLIRADILETFEMRKNIAEAALEAGFSAIVIRKEDIALTRLGKFTAIINDNGKLIVDGENIGVCKEFSKNTGMEEGYSITSPYAIIDSKDWKIIPLENLISRLTNTKLYAAVHSPEEGKTALLTMEKGTYGIAVAVDNPIAIKQFTNLITKDMPAIQLDEAEIVDITPLGLGDRVCIDTCSMMNKEEGMLIGSSSSCLFFVASESSESVYVNARPFRVNAGAVSSYILLPDGTTSYLSELKAGSPTLALKLDGSARTLYTGRVKVEVRPMLLITAKVDTKTYSVILQNAETIRLHTPKGAKSVSDIKVGDKVLVRLEEGARHFGHAVSETITEK